MYFLPFPPLCTPHAKFQSPTPGSRRIGSWRFLLQTTPTSNSSSSHCCSRMMHGSTCTFATRLPHHAGRWFCHRHRRRGLTLIVVGSKSFFWQQLLLLRLQYGPFPFSQLGIPRTIFGRPSRGSRIHHHQAELLCVAVGIRRGRRRHRHNATKTSGRKEPR